MRRAGRIFSITKKCKEGHFFITLKSAWSHKIWEKNKQDPSFIK